MDSRYRSRSYTQVWNATVRKLFPKHRSSLKARASGSRSSYYGTVASLADACSDGFCKYSEEMLEEERRSGRMRSSQSTACSYASALMGPSDLPPLPYTVSSPGWNILTSYVRYLDEIDDHSVDDRLQSVLYVWGRVYTVSKIVTMALMHYGVDLEGTPDSIMAHLKRAEDLVQTNSISDLIDNTENLFYALYARLIMEIAAADLCSTFTWEFRRPVKSAFILPEPIQLCRILYQCKQYMDAANMCVDLNDEIVRQHQKNYINRALDKVRNAGFILDDLIGYRQHALNVANNPKSEFLSKWNRPNILYEVPPAEVLVLQSEKYLALSPKLAVEQATPALDLPFIEKASIDPEVWKREHILDDRQATLAKLEGKSVGESRRFEGRRRLIDFVKERKCVCRAACICASDCTANVQRHCPCAERILSIMVAKRRDGIGVLPFGAQCSALAKSVFHAIASVRLDAGAADIRAEIDRGLIIFKEEIGKQRASVSGIPGTPSAITSPSSLLRSPASSSSCSSLLKSRDPRWIWGPKIRKTLVRRYHRAAWPSYGITTPVPVPDRNLPFSNSTSPFYFQTGYALCAKRAPRPFPPPFLSPPSSSFSDPLTTHYHNQDKRLSVRGELIRGLSNGDDAVLVAENFLGVNDGVGAWATKPRGHAALWSRLILHFWALEVEQIHSPDDAVDPIAYLQRAYEETTQATTAPSEWFGTTTSVTALLRKTLDGTGTEKPLLYVTNIGDCKVVVIRPGEEKVIFRTQEQWHWFDCPVQLGTNSVDTPQKNAVLSLVDLEEGDIVLALSDGVLDNLWEHEILSITLAGLKKWDHGRYDDKELDWAPPAVLAEEKMVFLARELLKAALAVAQDPFAESPYMEKAVDEGLAIQGGKMDDISVVVGACKRRQPGEERRMRAKRSKKYRKLMHQYELAFGFREPYQVLVDSNLLRAVHSFKMDLIPALERTLQGQVKPLLTKCSLARIMANQPTNPRTNNTVRPDFLPPPTTLPLRHCSHNADSTPIDEEECLISLLSPQTDIKRNKEHYILATSDPPAPSKGNNASNQEAGKKRKRGEDEGLAAVKRAQGLRRAARSIPGVPIVYVKRSVMILEPMSAPSEGIREGVEQDKFRVGLTDPEKKKREAANAGAGEGGEKKKKREVKKAKGPNPLSVKKPKKRADEAGEKPKKEKVVGDDEKRDDETKVNEDGEAAPKAKRRRRHKGARYTEVEAGTEEAAAAPMDEAED
ncbi:hypothetical protein BDV18DRAFT_154078 [Aspergillus unguis]